MRHFSSRQILVAGFALALQASVASAQAPQPDYVDAIIVKYRDDSGGVSKAQTVGAELGKRFAVGLRYKRQMARGAHVMSLDAPLPVDDAEKLARKLSVDPRVLYAEPDYRMHASLTPNDPAYVDQWHYSEATAGINLPTAWDKVTGTGAVIAVLDTGYRPHADLAANILQGYDFITNTSIANDGNARDTDAQDPGNWLSIGECGGGQPTQAQPSSWHGTHVSGTIAAVTNNSIGVAGVAYNAKVVPVRVLGKCGGVTSDIADAMVWAAGGTVSGVPANANPANVLNMSFGATAPCSQTYIDTIAAVRALNVSMVVAAGNESADVATSSPANCAGIIAVAAVSRTGARPTYSNFGTLVDLSAPGGDPAVAATNWILSTLNTGTTTPLADAYAWSIGTSMAAPHVSGVAALMYSFAKAKGRSLNPDQVESILKASARAFPVACTGCGTGIVDARAAVDKTEQFLNNAWLIPVLESILD